MITWIAWLAVAAAPGLVVVAALAAGVCVVLLCLEVWRRPS